MIGSTNTLLATWALVKQTKTPVRVLTHIHIPHTPRLVLPTPPARQLNNTDLNTT